MAIFRVEKNGNYTVMSNYHLDDKRLSLKAIGLLSKILRLPPDWDFTIEGLAAISKDGVASVRSGIEELEALGYIRRGQTHQADGTFGGNEYTVYEKPPDTPPLCENRMTVPPLCENPITENPIAENRRQINTYLPSTKETNPPKAPQGGQRAKSIPKHKPERFEAFWAAYPRGEARSEAVREWDKLKADDDLLDIMALALRKQLQSEMWRQGKGIPYAVRWLRNRRWEDTGIVLPADKGEATSWAPDPEVL